MATKLYVGNLTDSTTEQSLRELFDAFGPVTEVAVLHGFGFVHFRNPEDAQAARQALNETAFEGSHITVQISHTKGHGYKGGRGAERSSSGGGGRDDSRGRGRYGEYANKDYERYDRGYEYRYDDYHRGRYADGYPDGGGRYRGSEYRDHYYERDSGYGYPPRRDRSPVYARDYYRESHYDSYRDEPPYARDRYRDYDRERGAQYRPRY